MKCTSVNFMEFLSKFSLIGQLISKFKLSLLVSAMFDFHEINFIEHINVATFICLLRWPKWAIAKVFSKSRKKFSNQEKSFQIKQRIFKSRKKFSKSRTRKHDREHANTIKNTQTRSRTRKHDQKHVRARSKVLYQNREKIFEDKKEHTQLKIKENHKDFVTQFVERSPKRRFELLYQRPGVTHQIFYM